MIEIYLTGTEYNKCECCGRTDKLRHLPPIMSGKSGLKSERLICSYCIKVWYEYNITNSEDLGKECRRLEAAKEFPFSTAST